MRQCGGKRLVSGRLAVTNSTCVKANASRKSDNPDCNIIIAVTVTSGDVHDSQSYLEQWEYVYKNVVPLQVVAADSDYDLPFPCETCLPLARKTTERRWR